MIRWQCSGINIHEVIQDSLVMRKVLVRDLVMSERVLVYIAYQKKKKEYREYITHLLIQGRGGTSKKKIFVRKEVTCHNYCQNSC